MCKLLMIDDSPLDQMILDKLMGKYNLFHHKEFRSDAESAINEIEKNQLNEEKLPDVIFLDLMMPNFDGFAFLDRFKKLYAALDKKIDVFVVTSSIDPNHRRKSEKYDFVKDVLVKPLNRAVLSTIYMQYKHTFSFN